MEVAGTSFRSTNLRDLGRATNTSVPLLKKYRFIGLLPEALPNGGNDSREHSARFRSVWTERHVARVLLIKQLHDPEKRTLADVKKLIEATPEYGF